MVSLITDYVQDTAAKYIGAGITAVGTLAGNAVGGVGGLIENSGRAVGNGVSGGIGGVGTYINGYGDSLRGSMAPDGPVRGSVQAPGGNKQVARSTIPAKQLPSSKPPINKPKVNNPSIKAPINKPAISNPSVKAPTVGTSSIKSLSSAQSAARSPVTKKRTDGKVTISAESKPKKPTTPTSQLSTKQKLPDAKRPVVNHITGASVQTRK